MTKSSDEPHVYLAVTDSGPVERLWQAAIEKARDSGAEVTVLVVYDDRWRRAASLSFTREISRLGGVQSDFTARRAEQVAVEATARVRERTETLASAADVRCRIEILAEATEIRRILVGGRKTVFAPSLFRSHPLYEEARGLDCEIVFIE